jgi:hypothetical protein
VFLKKEGCQSKRKVDVSYLKKSQDEIHFCIKKEDNLCFTTSWNETTRHSKVEQKIITLKTIADGISKGKTLKSSTMAF